MKDRFSQPEKTTAHRRADRVDPARFRLIYESSDGRLCLFEDARGHLTAVRAAKLA